jgi:glutamate dehydrogenase (NADP+)
MPTMPKVSLYFLKNCTLYGWQGGELPVVFPYPVWNDTEQHAVSWARRKVDNRLKMIMQSIHKTCLDTAEPNGTRATM